MRSLLFALFLLPCAASAQRGFSWQDDPSGKKIVLAYGDKPITAYCFLDSIEKPILFPLTTPDGIVVTRGYPIAPRPGERTDHPHHTGLWLNYESVNGLDFWSNSNAIPQSRKHRYGSIRHVKVLDKSYSDEAAQLQTLSHWVDSAGTVLLEEVTGFRFRVNGGTLVIDRSSVLTARLPRVEFRDVKDGLLGIRVARELEMPSSQEDTFVDSQGNVTKVPKKDNAGVTGMYRSRQGIKGDAVWGTRSEWVVLSGKIDSKDISLGIIDHPSNPGYPTYWHARGYGLFAANPFGQFVFSNGKEQMNLILKEGESVSFQFRIVVGSSALSDGDMEALMNSFAAEQKK